MEELLSHMRELRPFSQVEMQVFHGLFLDYGILSFLPTNRPSV